VAQVIFHFLDEATEQPYRGKYQDQEYGPQEAR
jgi:deoxycytidine triphosphate deaminase